MVFVAAVRRRVVKAEGRLESVVRRTKGQRGKAAVRRRSTGRIAARRAGPGGPAM